MNVFFDRLKRLFIYVSTLLILFFFIALSCIPPHFSESDFTTTYISDCKGRETTV
ncbi:MAG TPA: hypothetical protein PLG34_07345 [Spirochaetota bacterium]|nr:hypothetical protein [Spirochaetota bacterium]HPY87782.1 hypothetical protein [Spirochaetota bacterium]